MHAFITWGQLIGTLYALAAALTVVTLIAIWWTVKGRG